jgi:hypothetical protein
MLAAAAWPLVDGSCLEKAPPGFEPGMKVLQTSGRHDATVDRIGSSCQVSDRSSLNLPFGDEITDDLAEIVDAWPELPEAIRARIVVLVRASLQAWTKTLPYSR